MATGATGRREAWGGGLRRALDSLRERLWFWPVLVGVVAAALAEALVRVDRRLDVENGRPLWVFSGDAAAARDVLSTIATATMSVLGVTLTITLAVLALTAQGYSPRVLRRFVRDRVVQAVVAGFTGAFVFSLVALRLVRQDQVPGVTVNVAAFLAFAVVILLIVFFHHLANEIRVERLIEAVWDETRRMIPRVFPSGVRDAPSEPADVPAGVPTSEARAPRAGRVQGFDDGPLARIAASSGGTLVVVPRAGDFVAEGEVVVRVFADIALDDDELADLGRAVLLGTQRTMTEDAGFGLRQLTDIALRALSPSVNDPTTATEAIARQVDLLRRLAARRLDDLQASHGDGRVIRPRATWDGLVGIAVDQVAAEAEAQADTTISLVLLDGLVRIAAAVEDPARLEALRRRARRVRDGARRAIAEPSDLARVEEAASALV